MRREAAFPAASRTLVAATCAFLFLAPFAGSAGLRATALFVAAGAAAYIVRSGFLAEMRALPRAVFATYVFWIVLCAASLLWTRDLAYSLSELRAQTLYGTLAFAAYYLAASDGARWRLWWLTIIASAIVAFAAYNLQQWGIVPATRHPIHGGDGAWSTHLVLVAPLLLALAWEPPWGEHRSLPIQVAALALLLLAAWQSQNRIVWAALGAQLLVATLLWRRVPSHDDSRTRRLQGLVALAAVAIACAFAFSIVERSVRVFHDGSMTTSLERDLRPRIFAAAWEQFRHAPLLGHGLGREILADRFLPVTPPGHDVSIRHGHNVFVNVALELGVVGLAAFVALMAALALGYGRMLARPGLAPLGVMGLTLIAGFLVKNLTDDFFYRHNALLFWAVNGMLLGFARMRAA